MLPLIPRLSRHRLSAALGLCLGLLAAASAARAAPVFKGGDLIAICGDSITEQRRYSVLVQTYLLACQPGPDVEVMQCGWIGENAYQFMKRLEADLLPFKPAVATVLYGMNDGLYRRLEDPVAKSFRSSLSGIATRLRTGGVREVVLLSPPNVDPRTFTRGDGNVYNPTLAAFGDIAREVAAEKNARFADVHGPMMDVMTRGQAAHGAEFTLGTGDGYHPDWAGAMVIAQSALRGLGCEGDLATFTLDAKTGRATASAGHRVLSASATKLELESTRYPFCFATGKTQAASTASVREFLPFDAELNRFVLRVTGLPPGRHTITWSAGDVTIAQQFPAEQLAAGLNLAAAFPKNPFEPAFVAVQNAVREQQAFDIEATKKILHALPAKRALSPEENAEADRVTAETLAKAAALRAASRAAVRPVRHTITLAQ